MKIQILDSGKHSLPENWEETIAEDNDGGMQLFIDGEYIGAATVSGSDTLIIVSCLHKIEFRKD